MTANEDKSNEFLKRINTCMGIIRSASRIYGRDATEQEDLYQEILLQLWRSYDSYAGTSQFSTWVYKVALNTALTFFGRLKKRRSIEVVPLTVKEPEAEQASRKDHLLILEEAMKSLAKIDRALLFLSLEKRSYEDMAEIMGISSSNVGVKLNRIKEKLRKRVIEIEKQNELNNGF